jgi:hypothetical protein
VLVVVGEQHLEEPLEQGVLVVAAMGAIHRVVVLLELPTPVEAVAVHGVVLVAQAVQA